MELECKKSWSRGSLTVFCQKLLAASTSKALVAGEYRTTARNWKTSTLPKPRTGDKFHLQLLYRFLMKALGPSPPQVQGRPELQLIR